MCSPEELSTAEANDAAVVTDVRVTRLGLVLSEIKMYFIYLLHVSLVLKPHSHWSVLSSK